MKTLKMIVFIDLELSNQLAKDYASKFDQTVLEVIPEKGSKDGKLVGYADNYMKIEFDGDESLIGELVKVKVIEPGYPINKGKLVKVINHATNKDERLVAY